MVDPNCKEEATIQKIQQFNAIAGKNIAVCYFSERWSNGIKFDAATCNAISLSGAIPFVRQQPSDSFDGGSGTSKNLTNARIAAGIFDKELTQYARDVKTYGKPVLLQYGVEVNGDWFSWSDEGPEPYKAAYRHIVDIFKAENVTNAIWCFQVDATDNDRGADWYPGDSIITWVGSSVYGAHEYGQNGCISELRKCYSKFAAISEKARLGIFEWGIGDSNDTKTTLETLANNDNNTEEFPRIEMLQVWNEGSCERGEFDGRINATPENLAEYQKGIINKVYTDKYY